MSPQTTLGTGGVELLYTPDYTEWHFMAGRSDVSVEQEQAGNPSRVAAGSTVPATTS